MAKIDLREIERRSHRVTGADGIPETLKELNSFAEVCPMSVVRALVKAARALRWVCDARDYPEELASRAETAKGMCADRFTDGEADRE